LNRLQIDFSKFRDEFSLMGRHLGHAQASYLNAERRLEQMAQRLLNVDQEQQDLLDPSSIDRPG
jgi:DNA anti-recombination protein RmuC